MIIGAFTSSPTLPGPDIHLLYGYNNLVASYLSPLLFSAMFFSPPALAHKVGDSSWCLVYTDTHQECVYDDASTCDATLKKVVSFTKAHPSKAPASEKDGTKVDLICLPNPARQDGFMTERPSGAPSSKKWNPDQPW